MESVGDTEWLFGTATRKKHTQPKFSVLSKALQHSDRSTWVARVEERILKSVCFSVRLNLYHPAFT